jgi:hypothetical protein
MEVVWVAVAIRTPILSLQSLWESLCWGPAERRRIRPPATIAYHAPGRSAVTTPITEKLAALGLPNKG